MTITTAVAHHRQATIPRISRTFPNLPDRCQIPRLFQVYPADSQPAVKLRRCHFSLHALLRSQLHVTITASICSPLRGGAVLRLLVGCRDNDRLLCAGRPLKDDVDAAGCDELASRRLTLNDVPPLFALLLMPIHLKLINQPVHIFKCYNRNRRISPLYRT